MATRTYVAVVPTAKDESKQLASFSSVATWNKPDSAEQFTLAEHSARSRAYAFSRTYARDHKVTTKVHVEHYDTCHHGLSLDLCFDPINHYGPDTY